MVLITGTRTGIGRALAEHLLARGDHVYGCSRGEASIDHPAYRHHRLDAADETAVKQLMAAIQKDHARLDALVNNAGIASMNHALLTPISTVERVLRTNVTATYLCCREAAKLMQRRKAGRIVNLSTVAVPLKLEGEAIYAASKAAVETLTRVLARELAPLGITVNAVGPGPIDTDLTRSVPAEKLDRVTAQQALHRRATFADVANVVDFFLQAESGMVTGQVLYLGGV